MIVALGDAVVDLLAWPLGSTLEGAEYFLPCAGGAPCNVVRSAALLGGAARFVGAVGPDGHGARLRAALERAGADASFLVTMPPRTGVTFVRIGLDGSRAFTAYRAGAADTRFGPEQLDALPGDPLAGATWLHLTSGSLLAEPLASATRKVVARAEALGVPLSVDLNVRPAQWDDAARLQSEVRWLAARARVLKASDEDLAGLGLPGTTEGLGALLEPGAVGLLTLAERGARALFRRAKGGGGTGSRAFRAVNTAAPAVKLVDPVGAGDAFVAAALVALGKLGVRANDPGALTDAGLWAQVLPIACAAGACVVTEAGATRALEQGGTAVTALRTWLARLAP